jgi:hypothetical protein
MMDARIPTRQVADTEVAAMTEVSAGAYEQMLIEAWVAG